MADHWYDHPLDQRAKPGGETGLNGRFYVGGEFMPFYVPREVMPQVNEDDYPGLLQFATTEGVQFTELLIPCEQLRPHQLVSMDRVRSAAIDPMVLRKQCLVSADRFVLDGNHRYWAHHLTGTPVPAIKFALPFPAAIKFLFAFPRTYSYSDGKHAAVQN